jgi:DNA mismatch repair protein MutL
LVSGFIGKPENARASRNQQYFFVRRRPVYSRTMAAALEEGYKNALPSGRSPVCVLDATLPPEHFDCNVHPAKTEVKFQHDRALFDAVYAAVRAALDASAERPDLRLPDARPSDYLSFAAGFTSEPPVMRDAAYAAVPRAAFPVHRSAYAPPDVPANAPAPPVPPPAPPEADYRVVGEVLGGYIVVEEAGGLALIDRHAAHERILYERLRAQDRELMPQTLLAPIVAALSPAEAQALLDRRDALETLGVCVEDFGGGSLRVTALPDGVEADDAAALLSELAQKLKRGGGKLTPAFVDELLHTVACKAAVKIGRGRSEWDAVTIADAVMTTPALKHCPHGRPVAVTLSKASIEKRFGR